MVVSLLLTCLLNFAKFGKLSIKRLALYICNQTVLQKKTVQTAKRLLIKTLKTNHNPYQAFWSITTPQLDRKDPQLNY